MPGPCYTRTLTFLCRAWGWDRVQEESETTLVGQEDDDHGSLRKAEKERERLQILPPKEAAVRMARAVGTARAAHWV